MDYITIQEVAKKWGLKERRVQVMCQKEKIPGVKRFGHDYMQQFDASHARKGLRDLFRVLNQKPEDRDPYLADDDPMAKAS